MISKMISAKDRHAERNQTAQTCFQKYKCRIASNLNSKMHPPSVKTSHASQIGCTRKPFTLCNVPFSRGSAAAERCGPSKLCREAVG